MKKVFIEGAITPEFIAQSLAKHQTKHSIGAHNIFLGQVRADEVAQQKVTASNIPVMKKWPTLNWRPLERKLFRNII